MAQNTTTILLIGRPGSGKGTQAKLLSEKLGWVRVSSGERIKAIRDGDEPFSARVREVYDKGSLLPDWFADYILEDSLLGLAPHVGIVMEGFARTRNQAEHLTDIIDWLGRSLVVLNLEVSEEEVARRMHARASVESRPDSNTEEKIQERLRQYNAMTAPALAYFKETVNVIDINGEETPEQIAESIVQALHRS